MYGTYNCDLNPIQVAVCLRRRSGRLAISLFRNFHLFSSLVPIRCGLFIELSPEIRVYDVKKSSVAQVHTRKENQELHKPDDFESGYELQ